MATDKQTIVESYPLPVYNYRVIIDGIAEDMSFSDVSGLEIEHDHVLYKHGFSWVMGSHLIRAQQKPINISLKRGILKSRSFLYDWLRSGEKKDIRIELCDENGLAIVSWDVHRALPFKLDAPSFSAGTNDIAIESLDLIAHDLKITHHE
ncbi:phage tail protein [uncultured Aquimarina sp.]|uniref:phage tail protein n=1 Tax=uncultured Aquimarina sp. TaxID=575652 RepID=UPI0026245CA7|nr:phage tail protein [uncultured Aquimarina sp.]